MQEQALPSQHELYRQFHHITHVYLLLEGTVELTAFTFIARHAHLHPDTLLPTSASVLQTVNAQAPGTPTSPGETWGRRSLHASMSVASAANAIAGGIHAYAGRNGLKVRLCHLQAFAYSIEPDLF